MDEGCVLSIPTDALKSLSSSLKCSEEQIKGFILQISFDVSVSSLCVSWDSVISIRERFNGVEKFIYLKYRLLLFICQDK